MSQGKLYTASLNCDDDKKGEPLYGVRLFYLFCHFFLFLKSIHFLRSVPNLSALW